MNILLIEDNEISSSAISAHLSLHGHEVYQANNGKEAIDISTEKKIDLIICDLMLPVISGITFLRLREKFIPVKVPVITISALENAQDILKTIDDDGKKFFLSKPFEFEKLMTLVNQINNQK